MQEDRGQEGKIGDWLKCEIVMVAWSYVEPVEAFKSAQILDHV